MRLKAFLAAAVVAGLWGGSALAANANASQDRIAQVLSSSALDRVPVAYARHRHHYRGRVVYYRRPVYRRVYAAPVRYYRPYRHHVRRVYVAPVRYYRPYRHHVRRVYVRPSYGYYGHRRWYGRPYGYYRPYRVRPVYGYGYRPYRYRPAYYYPGYRRPGVSVSIGF